MYYSQRVCRVRLRRLWLGFMNQTNGVPEPPFSLRRQCKTDILAIFGIVPVRTDDRAYLLVGLLLEQPIGFTENNLEDQHLCPRYLLVRPNPVRYRGLVFQILHCLRWHRVIHAIFNLVSPLQSRGICFLRKESTPRGIMRIIVRWQGG